MENVQTVKRMLSYIGLWVAVGLLGALFGLGVCRNFVELEYLTPIFSNTVFREVSLAQRIVWAGGGALSMVSIAFFMTRKLTLTLLQFLLMFANRHKPFLT